MFNIDYIGIFLLSSLSYRSIDSCCCWSSDHFHVWGQFLFEEEEKKWLILFCLIWDTWWWVEIVENQTNNSHNIIVDLISRTYWSVKIVKVFIIIINFEYSLIIYRYRLFMVRLILISSSFDNNNNNRKKIKESINRSFSLFRCKQVGGPHYHHLVSSIGKGLTSTTCCCCQISSSSKCHTQVFWLHFWPRSSNVNWFEKGFFLRNDEKKTTFHCG